LIIIAVSYDSTSLNLRMASLQRLGHVLVPASSLDGARKVIQDSTYHVLLIGATVPQLDRDDLAKLSKALRPRSKIISVEFPGSPRLEAADRYLKAGDENAILQAISALVSGDSESDLEARRR
jgi:O-acetylhomoserine/O-acetylserine sulfhydrylase-like pyridoxal-dependent enzyme